MEASAPISIAVVLAGKPYRLSVQPEEEAPIREAAKAVNERINRFQLQYSRVDKQDALALVVLQFAREAILARQALRADEEAMQELTCFLDVVLSETAP
jgi:cell division protein ZapA